MNRRAFFLTGAAAAVAPLALPSRGSQETSQAPRVEAWPIAPPAPGGRVVRTPAISRSAAPRTRTLTSAAAGMRSVEAGKRTLRRPAAKAGTTAKR